MRETLGSYAAARDFGQATFTNGARPALVVKHPRNMSAAAIERLTAQMDRLRGSKNAGKTVLLEENADLKEIGFPPKDAQFIETKEFELADMARWYGVPPHMVGLVDRSTSWGTGIEEQTLGFLTFTMDDWYVNWEQEINLQLLGGTGTFAEFTREALLRMDALKQAQVLDIERRNGVLNADEWRRLRNRPPLPDGEGETFLQPANTTTRTELVPTPKARGDGLAPEVTV
jgi:HK97 family phage portal protein